MDMDRTGTGTGSSEAKNVVINQVKTEVSAVPKTPPPKRKVHGHVGVPGLAIPCLTLDEELGRHA